jgi:hypothetical protein
MESCKRLWRKLPYGYLKANSFSDFWKAYNCTGDKVVFGKSRAGKRLAKLGQKGLVFV